MKQTYPLARPGDPFSFVVDLTAAALTGRPFSPPPTRFPSETEAVRSESRQPARASWLPRFDRFALGLGRQVATDVNPAEARARELRVLYRYF
jgi:hypothetical protein